MRDEVLKLLKEMDRLLLDCELGGYRFDVEKVPMDFGKIRRMGEGARRLLREAGPGYWWRTP